MAIDDDVKAAVEQAATKLRQPKTVSLRLIKWLEDMSERTLDPREDLQHLQKLRSAVVIQRTGDES